MKTNFPHGEDNDFLPVQASDRSSVAPDKLPDKAGKLILPDDTNITYFGRWDQRDADTYITSWPGTYFKVNFTGTSLQLRLGGASAIYVRIDGVETCHAAKGGIVDLTTTPLAPGTHELMVISPYNDQHLYFQGLILEEQAVTAAPDVGGRLIEFVGASIIAGHLLEKRALEDFAWLAAEQLGYEHTQIAQAGMALVNNWHGGSWIANGAGLSRQYFKLKDADADDSTPWNFSIYTPDAVVINVGTNDQYWGVPAAAYQAAYITFLEGIRLSYPNTVIYALRLFNGEYASETLAAVQARNQAGDANVYYVDTSGWLDSSDTLDGTHPTKTGHQKLALKMIEVLQALQ